MTDADKEAPDLLQFPCDFPVKIMGRSDPAFLPAMLTLARSHFPDFSEQNIEMRNSSGGRYLGITLNVRAESRAQLDAFYRSLTGHPLVKVVL
ncbi:MAG: DUF493 domain-containing protein [Rhodocyclaceae bacterium]|nr:DUF493 domain-containing protein [Rhodocyclaceae bacterium]MBX3666819.1 DUF493 domain-containing protein [Rhodocyclaceae bacterium]